MFFHSFFGELKDTTISLRNFLTSLQNILARKFKLFAILEPNASMDEELAFSMQLENYTESKDVSYWGKNHVEIAFQTFTII